jgi:hypothetical protein
MTLLAPAEIFHTAGRPPRLLTIARPLRIQSGGNHHPLLCEMEDESGPAGLWVVKPIAILSRSTDRGEFGVLAGLAGAEVCAWAGVLAPGVALTRFPDAVEESALTAIDPAERTEVLGLFRLNRGKLAFCCRFLDGAADLKPAHLERTRRRATTLPDAVALLTADAYLRHDDRRVENPNAVWLGQRLVALDHGSAFAGLTRPGVQGDDLARHTLLHSSSFQHHVAAEAAARADDACWEAITTRLEAVEPSAVNALASGWPAELDHDSQSGQRELRSRLAAFLGERGKHVRPLVDALREMLGRMP